MKTALLLLLLAAPMEAAQLRAWCRSVTLGTLRGFDPGGGYYQVLFTTTDNNSANVPRTYTGANGLQGSGEFKQSGTTDYFEAEYLVYYESFGVFGQWGAVSAFLPITDANGNTVPDWMEPANACNFSINAVMFTDYPNASSVLAPMTFTRAAGSVTGTYTIKAGTAPTLTGTWALSAVDGTATPNRAAGTIALSYGTAPEVRTASASFTPSGPNQVTIGTFTATGGTTPPASSGAPISLTRNGPNYTGPISFLDGNTLSPFADYQAWVVQVSDPADADADGVPDFSDAFLALPAITREPGLRFDFPVTPGYTYRIMGSTDLKTWTTYGSTTASGSVWSYTAPPGSRAFLRIVSP